MGAAVSLLAPQLRRFRAAIARRWFPVVPALTFLMPLIQFWNSGIHQTGGGSALHWGIAVSLRHGMERRYALLNASPVMGRGGISCSLYLWQPPLLDRSSSALWAAFPLNLIRASLLAAASFYLIEKACLKLRERFSPRRIPYVVAMRRAPAADANADGPMAGAESDSLTAVGGRHRARPFQRSPIKFTIPPPRVGLQFPQ